MMMIFLSGYLSLMLLLALEESISYFPKQEEVFLKMR